MIGLVGENGSGKHFAMMGTDPTMIKEMAERTNDKLSNYFDEGESF